MAIETARRREIDDAASSLFRERGYAGTSVRDIARALDIQGASLYAHVSSKEEVLRSIVDRAAAAFEVAADRADTEAESSTGDPVDRLAALIRAHVGVVTADPELAGVFVNEWHFLTGDARATTLARRDAYEQRFRTLIEDGVAVGAFVPTDPALASSFLLTALNGLAGWYRVDGRLGPDRIADHYVDLGLRALVGNDR